MNKRLPDKRNRPFCLCVLICVIGIILSAGSCTSGRRMQDINREKIMNFYSRWKGVPYRSGGTSRTGIDCSALMVILFSEQFNVSLPATAAEQARRGKRVSRNNLKVGDLVFFRISRRVRHVGVYIGNNRFIHASASRGVTEDELDSYWNKLYWRSRRVL